MNVLEEADKQADAKEKADAVEKEENLVDTEEEADMEEEEDDSSAGSGRSTSSGEDDSVDGEEYDEFENSLVFSQIGLNELRKAPLEILLTKLFQAPIPLYLEVYLEALKWRKD